MADTSHLKIKLRDLVRIRCRMRAFGLRDPKPSQPSPVFECRPILVNTASPDEKGCLVLADGCLIAVLVRVAEISVEQGRERLSGWHMDAGFGCCAVPVPPMFGTLADAVAWMRTQLGARQSATTKP